MKPLAPNGPSSGSTSHFRWVICGLLFLGTTINYLDRQVLALLKPILDLELGWTNEQFGYVNGAFFGVYAGCYLLFGWIVDRYGTKKGYGLAAFFWSVAAMGHGLANSVRGFFFARVALGFGEAGNFPSTIKAVGQWFPRRERALAASLFNAGTNVSAILGPATVPAIADHFGWRAAFVIIGGVGLIWLMLWLWLFSAPEKSRFVSAKELAHIRSDAEETGMAGDRLSWLALLRLRETWSIIAAKVLTDPVYWFFLIWLPDFYKKTRGLDLKGSGLYLVSIYAFATLVSTVGGALSGFLLRRGWSLTRARKTALFVFALCVVPVVFATWANPVVAVFIIGLACGAHQAWSANLYALTSDLFPKNAVAGVAGISGMLGSTGGIFFPIFVGALLDHYRANGTGETFGYTLVFGLCSTAYLAAFMLSHFITPKFQRIGAVHPISSSKTISAAEIK